MNERPISVLQFTNGVARGGAEEHILTLLRGLDRKRFRPHLVCPPLLAGKLQADVPPDVELIPLLLRKPGDAGAAFGLARILRSRRIDILHSHGFYSSLFASPVGWLCRVPAILETPHIREHWRRGWLKGRFVADRMTGRFVDYYIAVSQANADYLTQQKGLPARKVVVIRNGCDLTRFNSAPAPGLRAQLGFAPDDPVLLVVGRLEPQKGHRVLLDALPQVQARFPRVRLVCLGEGALRAELEGQAARLGVGECVHFAGFQADVPAWLAMADISVLPSFFEGLPLVAIESLAAGRPVVASAVDGTPEVVRDGENGVLVPPGNPADLAAAICRLLADPRRRAEMGAAGSRWVRERFSQERQLAQTQALYLRAFATSRRGRAAEAGRAAQADTLVAPETGWVPKS